MLDGVHEFSLLQSILHLGEQPLYMFTFFLGAGGDDSRGGGEVECHGRCTFYGEMLFHSPVSADSEEVLREACGREGACGFCVEEKLNTEFLKETEKRREN